FIICVQLGTAAQTSSPGPVAQGSADEKSQQIINKAIEVMGGASYLNVRSVIGKGFFTPFAEGAPAVPSRFLDYVVYPDHERTEFVSAGIKTIQTNVGDTGWLFDGAVKTINDQSQAQVDEFKRAMRTSV